MQELKNISKEGYNYIEEMFIKEYGYRYEELIRNRLSKTNYIFKSPPDITYFSLKELGYNPKKYKSLEKYYQDYINYRQVVDYIKKKTYKQIYQYLKINFSLTDNYLNKHLEEILNLDYQVFSDEYMNILKGPNDERLKSLIIERQNVFLTKCINLGLPLTSIDSILELDAYISLLASSNQIEILKLTNFGKELTTHISNTIDGIPYYKSLNYARKILFNDVSARTYPIKVNGNSYTIVHIPILELKDYGSIDHFLIHENIHSIESNNGKCGITGFHNSNYVTNELKTESKTTRLHNKMKKDGVFIFDTEQNCDKTENFYTPFVPLMDYLLQDYEDLFNYCSLYNKVSPLYKVFGRDNFNNFSMNVSNLYCSVTALNKLLKKGETLSFDLTAYKNQIDEMKTYSKRKIIK
ncbi:MAG TPA: hypothetical protein IAB38_03560 [Candidatus Onthousia excrementipullorum]|uniref:Uncharacterized protein n=1 Tax=Candidatus Onthousia excrementipullorum TaxID=2840884 RepID=A0A9D1DU88_9FIRM|nr:hypothetical protein [Candidatus Onthousia excrementipullorum]